MSPERRRTLFTAREQQAFDRLYLPSRPMTLKEAGSEVGLTTERMSQLSDSVFAKVVERNAFLRDKSHPRIDRRNALLVEMTENQLSRLTPGELKVIKARYLSDKVEPLHEIASRMRITKQRAHQLERQGLKKLRRALVEN